MRDKIIVGVCGAGAMGAGIAQVAAQAGHDVVVYDVSEAAVERGRRLLDDGLSALVKRGRLERSAADAVGARVRFTQALEDLAEAGLVIEAIIEDLAAKHDLFRRLEALVGPETLLASNTSSLSIGALASGLEQPERFAGLHFFNPATAMRLVEVVSGSATGAATAERLTALAGAWGKLPVAVRDVPGFIVNRVARPYYAEGLRAWGEGVGSPAHIDGAFRAAGFRMGPLELADLIGHDVNFAVARSVYDAYFGRTRFRPEPAQAALVAAGRLGRKAGRGVYVPSPAPAATEAIAPEAGSPEAIAVMATLSQGREAVFDGVALAPADGRSAARRAAEAGGPCIVVDWTADEAAFVFAASDPELEHVASRLARAAGRAPTGLKDRPGGLVLRTLAQLANAAADAVRDQVAEEDAIDAALVHGANYPTGPLAWARRFGLDGVVRALDHIAEETGEDLYRPSDLLRRLAWSQQP